MSSIELCYCGHYQGIPLPIVKTLSESTVGVTPPSVASFVWQDAPADGGQENYFQAADAQTSMRSVFQSHPSPSSATVPVEEATVGHLSDRYNT